ncbi:MAG: phage protein, partial [Terriglobia bacterium]
MSELQYLRTLSVQVGTDSGQGLDFAQFRVVFQVRRGDIQTPNSADVRIYNVSDQTANRIGSKEFTRLTLQ